MARPLQKKKNRSSLPRIRQRSTSKSSTAKSKSSSLLRSTIKSKPLLAQNWDPSQTIRQNYTRLGLTARLKAETGGAERQPHLDTHHDDRKTAEKNEKQNEKVDSLAQFGRLSDRAKLAKNGVGSETVKVQRDAQGNIVRVLRADHDEDDEDDDLGHNIYQQKKKKHNPLNDPLNDLSSPNSSLSETENPQSELLQIPHPHSQKGTRRHQSANERIWLQNLIDRHSENYTAMARDRALNPRQQSEGEIRRRVGIWQRQRAQ